MGVRHETPAAAAEEENEHDFASEYRAHISVVMLVVLSMALLEVLRPYRTGGEDVKGADGEKVIGDLSVLPNLHPGDDHEIGVAPGSSARPPLGKPPHDVGDDGDDPCEHDTTACLKTESTSSTESREATGPATLESLKRGMVDFIHATTRLSPAEGYCALDGAVTAPTVGIEGCLIGNIQRGHRNGQVAGRCRVDFAAMRGCPLEPARMGNFTNPRDLVAFSHFPVVEDNARRRGSVSAQDRSLYWARNPDPFDVRCGTCGNSLAQSSLLYSVRRWWCLPSYYVYAADAGGKETRLQYTTLGLTKDEFVAAKFMMSKDEDPPPPDQWLHMPLVSLKRVVVCMPPEIDIVTGEEAAFVMVAFGDGPKRVAHLWRMAIGSAGVECLWRTLELLFSIDESSAKIEVSGGNVVTVERVTTRRDQCGGQDESLIAAGLLGNGLLPQLEPMPVTTRFPYLPCMRSRVGDLQKQAKREGLMDDKWLTFWANRCDNAFNGQCVGASTPQEKLGLPATAKGSPEKIKVAVALSGFFRSFPYTREHIYRNLVYPHDADVFALTWNVLGRVKKGLPIKKKLLVPLPRMHAMVMGLLQASVRRGTTPEAFAKSHTVEIWDFTRRFRFHNVVSASGFYHAGMYDQLAHSVQMVLQSKRVYDIVIRTRWDIYLQAPFFFQRLPQAPGAEAASRYELDLGAHCDMEGAWFPRKLVVEPGKFLRHTADTRYKLFGWQVCDWIDVATYDTMIHLAGIYSWVKRHNVFSGAQFVDHAFFIDQGLSYEPAQLYVCLQRHGAKFFC
jgi:hypothetical protein